MRRAEREASKMFDAADRLGFVVAAGGGSLLDLCDVLDAVFRQAKSGFEDGRLAATNTTAFTKIGRYPVWTP